MIYETIGYLIGLALLGGIGALIGRNRKIGAEWAFVLGFFLGIIGWIIAACSHKIDTDFVEVERRNKK